MNQRKLKRIKSIYQDGGSPETCAMAILEMSTNNVQAAQYLVAFFKDVWVKSYQDELLKAKEKLTTMKGGFLYELRNGEKDPNLVYKRPDEG